MALQYLPHEAFVLGAQMLDDDYGHAGGGRQVVDKGLQGFQSPGGGADAHNGERFLGGFVGVLSLGGYSIIAGFLPWLLHDPSLVSEALYLNPWLRVQSRFIRNSFSALLVDIPARFGGHLGPRKTHKRSSYRSYFS